MQERRYCSLDLFNPLCRSLVSLQQQNSLYHPSIHFLYLLICFRDSVHSLIYTVLNDLTFMSLDCGRKQEQPEETNVNTEMPQLPRWRLNLKPSCPEATVQTSEPSCRPQIVPIPTKKYELQPARHHFGVQTVRYCNFVSSGASGACKHHDSGWLEKHSTPQCTFSRFL